MKMNYFKDKYDLVNWIFNAEFQRIAQDFFTDSDVMSFQRWL